MNPLIIAHRGYSARAPENTLAAFQMAMDAGADGVEFDVQLSKDGVPVVIHDYDLNRVAGRNIRVSDLTSGELTSTDVGSWFNRKHSDLARDEFAKQTVPTLMQVVDRLPPMIKKIYVELKCESGDFRPLVIAVCETLSKSPLLDRVVIKSFRLGAIAQVRALLPQVETAGLFEPLIMTILRRRRHIILMAREFGAHGVSLHSSLATPKLCSYAREAGMPIAVWTVDDHRWLGRALRRGIGSLITNDPSTFLS